jgi:hypothetical protein
LHPFPLKVLGEMREHRECVGETERTVPVGKRRAQLVHIERPEWQVSTAPVDQPPVYVAAVQLDRDSAPVPCNATTSAPEIENRRRTRRIRPALVKQLSNQARVTSTAHEEYVRVGLSWADPHAQMRRGHRKGPRLAPSPWAERSARGYETLVRPDRRTQDMRLVKGRRCPPSPSPTRRSGHSPTSLDADERWARSGR